jgi:diguanylate cyclase (GGDEF)-like protein
MLRPETRARAGLWLTCGGLLILAGHLLLTAYQPGLAADQPVMLLAAALGCLVAGSGIALTVGGRRDAGKLASGPPSSWAAEPVSPQDEAARRITEAFLSWCDEDLCDTNTWSAFDQFVRELLTEQLGAARVRCFRVLPGSQRLRSLSQHGEQNEGRSARSGILGHVATTGRPYVAGGVSHGELIDQLAEDGTERWDWVFPIREGGQTVALVATCRPGIASPPGQASQTLPFDRPVRQTLSVLIAAFWRHVAALEQLRIAERTDKASGLLTRSDFFDRATRALAESYAENEPIVVVALALEGLRRLDDVGRWSERDALVETIGRLIKRRIRTDDIIGRFSDDRFVVLLRRLDSSLGRLIAAKIQDTARRQVAQLDGVHSSLRVRVGVIGSGFAKRPLEALLVSAFDAVELARKENLALHCDLEPMTQPAEKTSDPRPQDEKELRTSVREG